MIYIIRTKKELEKLYNKQGCWLSSYMLNYAEEIITKPKLTPVNQTEALVYRGLYWHPLTFRKAEIEDLKDIVFISKEDFKIIKD